MFTTKVLGSRTPQARTRRRLGWLGAGMFTAAALLGPAMGHVSATVAGTQLHQTPPISWDDSEFQGSKDDCKGADLGAGQVLWHFVLTSTTTDNTKTLHTQFDDAGWIQTAFDKKSGPVIHWNVVTGRDTLLGAWTDAIGTNLNLSHICVGPEETTSTSSTSSTTTAETTTAETTTAETTTDETTTAETTTAETTTDETTTAETTTAETTTAETTTAETTTGETTTDATTTGETTTDATSTTTTGSVKGTTGTPKPTLPPTSTVGGSSGGNSGSISLGLLLLAAGSLGLVLVSPSPKKNRR